MSLFERLRGTVSALFQVGGPSGPAWKSNTGIDARDSADANYVNVRGADPVLAQDLMTLGYASISNGNLPYPALQTHKVRWLNGETAAYNSSSPTGGLQYSGWSTLNFNNVTTTPAANTTTKLGATKRLRFQSTVVAALVGLFEGGYVNAGVVQWGAWRGNAPNRGGFLFRTRFSITSIGVSSTIHAFVGILEAVSQQSSSTDYTTEINDCKLGIGFTCTTTAGGAFPAQNWQAIESAHAAPHLTDLGAGFALTVNDFIEVIMYAAPNDTKVTLTVNNLTTGATNTVTLNTTLPTNTTFLGTQIVFGVQTITSGTDAMDISLVYLEHFDG